MRDRARVRTGEGQGRDFAAADRDGVHVGDRVLDPVIHVVVGPVGNRRNRHGARQGAAVQRDLGDAVDGPGIDDLAFLDATPGGNRREPLAAVRAVRQQLQPQIVASRIRHRLSGVVQHLYLEPLHLLAALAGDVERRRIDDEAHQRRQSGAHARPHRDRQIGDDGFVGIRICGGCPQDDRARRAAGMEVGRYRSGGIFKRQAPERQRIAIVILVFFVAVKIEQRAAGQTGDDIDGHARRREQTVVFLDLHREGVGERPRGVGSCIGRVGLQHGLVGGDADFHGVGAGKTTITSPATTTRQYQTQQQKRKPSEYSANYRKHGVLSLHSELFEFGKIDLTLGKRTIFQDLRRYEDQQFAFCI